MYNKTHKFADVPDYGMYTKKGDSRLHTLKKRLVKRAEKLGERYTIEKAKEVYDFYNSQMSKIEETYPECFDTEPRDCLVYALKRDCPTFDWDLLD